MSTGSKYLSILVAGFWLIACGDLQTTGLPAHGDLQMAPAGSGEVVFSCGASGLNSPAPKCSSHRPCKDNLPYQPKLITVGTFVPTCRTPAGSGPRPYYDDGEPVRWDAPSGIDRYHCEYRPTGASAQSARPLVIFFHGGGGSADNVYRFTSLRAKAPTFDLSGDPARPGFVLVAIQGRNLHWPTVDRRNGTHADHWFRDTTTYSKNPDVAFADHIIDRLVGVGVVDPAQVYVMGISNGAYFGQLYAFARHDTPTPGGNRVAAAAVFSAGSPYGTPNLASLPNCSTSPQASQLPLMHVGRNCDLVPCNADQEQKFLSLGIEPMPDSPQEEWFARIVGEMGNTNATRRIVSGSGQVRQDCMAAGLCSYAVAAINHVRWPDGIDDGSGIDHEADMLRFMAAYRR